MIRGLNLPGTPRATSACRGIPLLLYFTFTLLQHGVIVRSVWTGLLFVYFCIHRNVRAPQNVGKQLYYSAVSRAVVVLNRPESGVTSESLIALPHVVHYEWICLIIYEVCDVGYD